MKLKKIDDKWEIDDDGELYGPYDTKKEALEEKRGLELFYKHEADPGFVTIESDREGRID